MGERPALKPFQKQFADAVFVEVGGGAADFFIALEDDEGGLPADAVGAEEFFLGVEVHLEGGNVREGFFMKDGLRERQLPRADRSPVGVYGDDDGLAGGPGLLEGGAVVGPPFVAGEGGGGREKKSENEDEHIETQGVFPH